MLNQKINIIFEHELDNTDETNNINNQNGGSIITNSVNMYSYDNMLFLYKIDKIISRIFDII